METSVFAVSDVAVRFRKRHRCTPNIAVYGRNIFFAKTHFFRQHTAVMEAAGDGLPCEAERRRGKLN
jgi:hypothetical protein